MTRNLLSAHRQRIAAILISCVGEVACHPSRPTCPADPQRASRTAANPTGFTSSTAPRNVILLLSDGTAPEAWTLARWYKGKSLNVDPILTGAIRTYGADSLITDSAPGASAYATGKKGSDQGIAVGAWNHTVEAASVDPKLAYTPLVTLLEAARVAGFATGLVATSNIQHATPAAFSAHVRDRNRYEEIAEQQAYQGIDVVLSGGSKYLLPKSVPGGEREDGEDLVTLLRQRGYRYVTTKTDLDASRSGRTWGAFASNDLAYEIDRKRFAPTQPSLAEMTDYAIANLANSARGNNRGFFLFVEGSKIDWSAHANDPVGVVSDLLAFDDAVGQALRFSKSRPNTQVIVVADHGTGGLTLGSVIDPHYSTTDDEEVLAPLRRARMTAEQLGLLVGAAQSDSQVRELLRAEWGLADVTEPELAAISTAIQNGKLHVELGHLISRRARIGWTSTGHTGADVLLFAAGPNHPSGLVENTSVGLGIAAFLGLDLERLQSRLFVNATAALESHGYAVSLDRSDPHNGQLIVEKNGRQARMPWAKNRLLVDQRSVELEGLVVHADAIGQVFVPRQAIDWILRELP